MISVVIPNWNGKRFLKDFFESALGQRVEGEEVELIVVDNGSTDGSREVIQDFYPGVRIVALDANRGFSAAVNAGIKVARGEWIALFNNDLRMTPSTLEAMYMTLRKHPETGFCAAKMLLFDQPHLINAAGDGVGLDGNPFNVGFLQPDHNQFNKERRILSACAGAAMYRRSMLAEIGPFDEDFFLNFEDIDLCLRANLMGYQGIYAPEAVVYHHHSSTMQPGSYRHAFFTSKNALNILVKNFPLAVFLRCFPWIFMEEIRRCIIGFFSGQANAYIHAKVAYLRELRTMLAKRRVIQNCRQLSSQEFISLLTMDRKV